MPVSKNGEKMRDDPTRLLNNAVGEAVESIARRIEDRLDQKGTPAATDVAALRHRLGQTQNEFAAFIHVSIGTIRNWEQGRRIPRGPARILLNVIAQRPEIVREALNEAASS